MPIEKSKKEKTRLHPRNRNREKYDFAALVKTQPGLVNHIKPSKSGSDSIDFSNPIAVKILNKALLSHYYGIKNWGFPDENLCPPIPGRADYIHHIADLLSGNNEDAIPRGNKITCLDIGVGASCIYPIIGVVEYDWYFIGSDIDPNSIASAQQIVATNEALKNKIEFKLQENRDFIFRNIITNIDKIDVSICNPPFHASLEDAQRGTRRKSKYLYGKKVKTPQRNFAGNHNELIYEGGEYQFILTMIKESQSFAKNCCWFTSLVSKQSNLKGIYRALEKIGVRKAQTITMGTGNKSSRIVAWTWLSDAQRKAWNIAE